MPPLPVIAGTTRVAFVWDIDTVGHAVNVMHFRQAVQDSSALEAAILASWTAGMLDAVSDQAQIVRLDLTALDGVTATQTAVVPDIAKWQGQGTGGAVPAVACVVKEQTGLRGKSHQGRVYLPAIAEGAQAGGKISVGQSASMSAAWQDFLEGMAELNCDWVVASYKLETASEVVTATAEQVLATQRRRQSRLRT